MKGIVFTEFLEMVEERFSPDMVDRIIAGADLASDGAYTALGTYDHEEMIRLVSALSEETQESADELMRSFGAYLFGRFHANYPHLFDGVTSAFEFLERIDDYVHVEVRKLYPDAELPSFQCKATGSGRLRLAYRSARSFAALAEGLIVGCLGHFGEAIDVGIEDKSDGAGTAVDFVLVKKTGL